MFSNLIESGSHAHDFKRRGAFFLGACALYAVLTLAAGVGSIYAYNTHLDQQNLELVTLIAPVPFRAQTEARPPRADEQKPAASGGFNDRAVAMVKEIVRNTPVTPTGEVASADTPELKAGTPFVIGDRNLPVPQSGGLLGLVQVGASGDSGGRNNIPHQTVRISEDEQPPLPQATPAPRPPIRDRINLSSTVLSGKAISKPTPAYPVIAKNMRVSGTVAVQILVDEQGRVISAQATSGHRLLQPAAVQAAYQARFTPTLLSQQPVKVSGIITYNFVLQ